MTPISPKKNAQNSDNSIFGINHRQSDLQPSEVILSSLESMDSKAENLIKDQFKKLKTGLRMVQRQVEKAIAVDFKEKQEEDDDKINHVEFLI